VCRLIGLLQIGGILAAGCGMWLATNPATAAAAAAAFGTGTAAGTMKEESNKSA